MKPVRLWILGAALGCFGAGAGIGLAAPGLAQACCGTAVPLDPDEYYVRQMIADFDLDATQARSLRMVVQSRRSETAAVLRELAERQPEELQTRLRELQAREEQRCRQILAKRPQQLASYEQRLRAGNR